MKEISGIVTRFGQIVYEAEGIISEAISAGRVPDEPSITNRFLQELESTINRTNPIRGVQLLATTMSSLGRNTQESHVGADYLAVINIDIPGMTISKGFLCQAKREGKSVNINRVTPRRMSVGFNNSTELHRLQQQVTKMLNVTPDSFVCIYSSDGFAFVPAVSVHGLNYSNDGNRVYAKNTRLFFSEFLMCFIGDTNLGARDDANLNVLAEQTRSRFALMIQIKPAR